MTKSSDARWAADDERGTLNLIDDAARLRASAEIRTGMSVSLARDVSPVPFVVGPGAPTTNGATAWQQALIYTGAPLAAIAELWTVTPHHPRLTHLDAPSHVVVDDMVYPGVPVTERVGPHGVLRGSTSVFADGITTRGVFLDLAPGARLPPGTRVSAADLDAALSRSGQQLHPGDAVVVRAGIDPAAADGLPTPGVTASVVDWLRDHDVSVWVGDLGDTWPPPDADVPLPLHRLGTAGLGLPLVDSAYLERLATACATTGRTAFLLVLAPPRVMGASGVPVNPIAIF
ncbi:cyclase family protein [Streptomyces monashensis]|uniref:cyclase family protein n=1 Tax=Streptomyces monashensis TaxID=1678012 RepID=UPI0033EE6AF0